MADQRDSDTELSPDVRAELVATRRGHPAGLKITIPLAVLAALVGWIGVDVTKSQGNVEQRLQDAERAVARNITETAVIRSEQQNIQRSLDRIETALEELRRERRR